MKDLIKQLGKQKQIIKYTLSDEDIEDVIKYGNLIVSMKESKNQKKMHPLDRDSMLQIIASRIGKRLAEEMMHAPYSLEIEKYYENRCVR